MNRRGTSLRDRLPFRLGTTSYVLPADIVPNVEFLASRVDDIELVLFESDEVSDLPGEQAIQTLKQVAATNGLTYTVHLPLDIQLGASDEAERRSSVGKCLRTIERVAPLAPLAHIVHFDQGEPGDVASSDAARWLASLAASVSEFIDAGVDPKSLCVETLDYPFGLVDGLVFEHGLSICLDVGHVLALDGPLESYLDRYLGRSRVVHLHGATKSGDHRDISAMETDQLRMLLSRLCSETIPERVVTLEVFNQRDFEMSLEVLEKLVTWEKPHS